MSYFFLGQGKLFTALRTVTGGPTLTLGGYTYLGECSALEVNLGAHLSQTAGGGAETRANANRVAEPPSFTLSMEEFSSPNLATVLYGANTAVGAGTVTNETVIASLGNMVPLANINLSSFTSLRNSALSTTYVLGTDYTVNLKAGSITILSTGAITDLQSLRATYVNKASTKISVGTVAPAQYALRFEGLNVAQSNDPVVIDIYKTRFWPLDKLPLIGRQHISLSLTGRVYYDDLQADTTTDGRWLRIRKV